MAVYVENTLEVGREHRESVKVQHQEEIEVAQNIKKLVRKFCKEQDKVRLHLEDPTSGDGMYLDVNKTISRETYMNVIEDREVQGIMKELDIFNERVHLFDVIDADDDNKLSLQEIVQGLLRIRGESKKSDVLAAALGIRAAHEAVRKLRTYQVNMMSKLDQVLEMVSTHSL